MELNYFSTQQEKEESFYAEGKLDIPCSCWGNNYYLNVRDEHQI